MAKKIPLSQGEYAIVDDEDYEWLMQWKWSLKKNCNNKYAVRAERLVLEDGSKKTKMIRMHRAIINAPDGVLIDHVDRNGLNNTRNNLRLCNAGENSRNISKLNTGKATSKYKGVYKKRHSTWVASIEVDHRFIYIGSFLTEESAAMAYNESAKKYHKEFAYLNDVDVPDYMEHLSMNGIKSKLTGCTSRYRGVSKHENKWVAGIGYDKKREYLGIFETETEAALAYNEAALKYHGEFAKLNIIEEDQ